MWLDVVWRCGKDNADGLLPAAEEVHRELSPEIVVPLPAMSFRVCPRGRMGGRANYAYLYHIRRFSKHSQLRTTHLVVLGEKPELRTSKHSLTRAVPNEISV
jgi:hypothetical protein